MIVPFQPRDLTCGVTTQTKADACHRHVETVKCDSFYYACRLHGRKATKVTFSLRVAVLGSRSPRENVFDALGRKVELNQGDVAIKSFAVMRDQPIPEAKAAHA